MKSERRAAPLDRHTVFGPSTLMVLRILPRRDLRWITTAEGGNITENHQRPSLFSQFVGLCIYLSVSGDVDYVRSDGTRPQYTTVAYEVDFQMQENTQGDNGRCGCRSCSHKARGLIKPEDIKKVRRDAKNVQGNAC
jgi:hypothetical protein